MQSRGIARGAPSGTSRRFFPDWGPACGSQTSWFELHDGILVVGPSSSGPRPWCSPCPPRTGLVPGKMVPVVDSPERRPGIVDLPSRWSSGSSPHFPHLTVSLPGSLEEAILRTGPSSAWASAGWWPTWSHGSGASLTSWPCDAMSSSARDPRCGSVEPVWPAPGSPWRGWTGSAGLSGSGQSGSKGFEPGPLQSSSMVVFKTSNSLPDDLNCSWADITPAKLSGVNCDSGTLKAPVGPKWHWTVNPSFLKLILKPLLGSKCNTAWQWIRKGKEMRKGAVRDSPCSKTAGRRKLPRLPRLVGITATYLVVDVPWTDRKRCSWGTSCVCNPGGKDAFIFLRVSMPTAILWHPVSTVAHSSSLGISGLLWQLLILSFQYKSSSFLQTAWSPTPKEKPLTSQQSSTRRPL